MDHKILKLIALAGAADFRVVLTGFRLILLRPLNPEGRDWLGGNLPQEQLCIGQDAAFETQEGLDPILVQIAADGLRVAVW